MIRYSLVCDSGHASEGWFRNSSDFDRQQTGGHLSCPLCGSLQIVKGLMAPAVSTSRSREARSAEPAGNKDGSMRESDPVSVSGAAVAPPSNTAAILPPDLRQKEIAAAYRLLRAQIIANAENVGSDFAREARKMHHGETQERTIYGETTRKDAEALLDEGIDILPLPAPPEDAN
ncbi:DUF1178 family protein [Roseibium aquae]|nr:DUF1178 family protein [Roseibium aquae]